VLRNEFNTGGDYAAMTAGWEAQRQTFRTQRAPYLLYPER
jgi:hypothetical protein